MRTREGFLGNLTPLALAVFDELAGGWPGGKAGKRLPWFPLRQLRLWAPLVAVHELLALGLVEYWDGVKGGPYLIISPLGSAVVGLELQEWAIGQAPRWGTRGVKLPGDVCHPEILTDLRRPAKNADPYPERVEVSAPTSSEKPAPKGRRRIAVKPMLDSWTGREIRLFAGPNGQSPGVPIMVGAE